MTTQHTAPTSRTREKITGDEEAAADLKLGEFQNVPTLTLSEARLIINAVMDHRKGQRKVEETEYALHRRKHNVNYILMQQVKGA